MKLCGGFRKFFWRAVFATVAVLGVFGVTSVFGGMTNNNVAALEAGDIRLELQPAEQEIELYPGLTYQGSITVRNAGRLPFSFTVSTRPYSLTGENYDPDYTTMTDYTKLANWFKFSQTSYQLAAGESVSVDFVIEMPSDDVPSGGQYAAIIVETRDGVDPDSAIRQVNQLAALVFARVDGGDIRESGSIIQHNLPSIILGGKISASETIKNTGNIDFKANHTVSVVDFFTGKEVFGVDSRDELGNSAGSTRKLIFPGTERSDTITWENTPQLGVFRVTQTVSFLDESQTYSQMVFVIPLWLVVLVGVFIGLLVLWIILRIFKRRRGRPQVI